MGNLSKYFDREEFSCKCGCGFATVDYELVKVLEDVREYFGSPITINSGCRCPIHNKRVGGEEGSKHLEGIAADFVVKHVHEDTVADYLEQKYPRIYGIGRYKGRTHVDVRGKKARWKR